MKLLACLLTLCVGCEPPEYNHLFDTGACVSMKIDGLQGMVITRYKHHGRLLIRFSATSAQTTDSFLGGVHDVGSKPYSLTSVHEFELVKCDT